MERTDFTPGRVARRGCGGDALGVTRPPVPHAAPDDIDDGRWGWTPGRVISSLLLLGIIAFWVWAFSPWAPSGHPDTLDDERFGELAEARCAEALELHEATIPLAVEAADGLERADQIDAGTAIFTAMIDDVEALAPPTGTRDGDLVARWLADWRTYLADRDAYAADFRAGIDDAFGVTSRDGDQITAPIDLFADINDMESCASPTDV